MINPAIVRLVCFCVRHRWMVVIVGILLTIGAGTFAAAKFSINTDVEGLISENIPWHRRQLELSKAFPQKGIAVVVKAPTAENAELATNQLAESLAKKPELF